MDHYLDDVVLVGPPKSKVCGEGLEIALQICQEMGFPVSQEKTVHPVLVITVHLEMRLPAEKLTKLRVLLNSWRRQMHARCPSWQAISLWNICFVVSL